MEIIIQCSDNVRGGKNIFGEPIEEIVRCKECRHNLGGRCLEFADDNLRVNADDFCSYGERSE